VTVSELQMDHKRRMKRTQEALQAARLDMLIVTHLPNVRYLCGFTGSAGILSINNREAVFFTDGRYTEQSREQVRAAKIRIAKGKSAQAGLNDWLNGARGLRRIGIEAAHLSVSERDGFAKFVPPGARLVKAPSIIEQMRIIKDENEVKMIRDACHLGVRLLDRLKKVLRPGIRESQVAGAIEYEARKLGAEQMAFSTIIAGGSRSALPHGRASWARLPARGFVVCDFGVILAGYCSDMTRTVHLGRPGVEARAAYEAVNEAQQAAIDAVRPGARLGEVDQAARKLLYNRGLEKYFTHSTGHGLGLEIHEAPRVAAEQNETLRSGMVITIEPGVYLPGKFGLRIEDTVVVTENGCEILTPCSKEMISI
jgi:Xaa-Pro aminopeptidase